MDTICAIATPSGGALGIVRVSGPQAISATSEIFKPKGSMPLDQRHGGTITFGNIINPDTDELIEEVLISLFRSPHSYTGEDSCEISCHGSEYILAQIVRLLLAQGCRMARPGEYTERAFLNGKMDLSQAEAVADLIASTTEANHRMAMQQMRGGFSKELAQLRDQLLHITSLLELELDFSDHEDLEFASRTELRDLAHEIHDHISALCQSFRLGNALKRGIPVAIVGETNAGKSTLLNALVGEERALVSEVRGTTRDTIEETINVSGILVRFIDTAGIRNTTDKVERMGIDRTFAKISEADIVLWLVDLTQYQTQYDTDDTPKVLAEAYVLNEEVLAQAVEILSKEHLENVAMDSTHISGTLSLKEAGRLILSVPYEEGWTVQIDGENAEPEQFGNALMAFDLEAGEHTIQMHYVPEGRNIGILVSAGSVLILLGCVLCQRCDRKRKDCAENEPSQKAADETMENGNAEKTHTEEGPVKEEAGRM